MNSLSKFLSTRSIFLRFMLRASISLLENVNVQNAHQKRVYRKLQIKYFKVFLIILLVTNQKGKKIMLVRNNQQLNSAFLEF